MKARVEVISVEDGSKKFDEEVDVGTTAKGYGFYILDSIHNVRIWVSWEKGGKT